MKEQTARAADPEEGPQAQPTEGQLKSLHRAVSGQSLLNYPAIFAVLMAKGIPEHAIDPRANVFTFGAWKALGRVVNPGNKGVPITTFRRNAEGESFPCVGYVWHISQTRDAADPKPSDEETAATKARELELAGLTAEQKERAKNPPPKPDPEAEPSSALQLAASTADCDVERIPLTLNPDPVKVEPLEPIAADPDPAPEANAEQPALIGLEPIAPAPADCPHLAREIMPGMPCVACGAFCHE